MANELEIRVTMPDASLAALVVVFIDRPLAIQWISRSGEIQQIQHLRFEDIATARQHAEALRHAAAHIRGLSLGWTARADDIDAAADFFSPKEEV